VGVYVDDLTIAAANVDTLARFKTEMSKRYEMKDLGELHFILGLQVKRDRSARTLHLSQKQYINTVLERFDMLGCKPAKSPLRSKTVMSLREEGEEKAHQARYLAAVGSLMDAMLGTRPDLAYPVGLLGRFASDPSVTLWDGVLSVFKYISSTRAILESPTLGGANSSMAAVMQTLPPAMSIDVESPVAMSSDYGGSY